MQTRAPIIENDSQRSTATRFEGTDKQTGFTSRALLAVPMQIKDRVLGVIEVVNRKDGLPFVEDDQNRPPTAVLKAEKLIRSDQVHMLVGGVLASTGYALAPVSSREKVVYLPSVAAADDLTQRDSSKYPYLVRDESKPDLLSEILKAK